MFESITIKGYKSIKNQQVALDRINLLIGGNGAGKTNFLSAFDFARIAYNGDTADYVEDCGGANRLLYMGRKHTARIHLHFELDDKASRDVSGVDMIFRESSDRLHMSLSGDFMESREFSSQNAERVLGKVFSSLRVYHFADTGRTSPIFHSAEVYDNRFLRTDASNLASILYHISIHHPGRFVRIEETIRQIAPFFAGFRLNPLRGKRDLIRLEWKQDGLYDTYMDAQDLSDGTLRMICLVTLLMQPDVPAVVLIDEPELGLHPAALSLFCSLVKRASRNSQIILSTQSIDIINQFSANDVIVCDNAGRETRYHRLSESALGNWLNDYTLGELWEKNVFGGNP